jgi:predicted adenylyl cyclase CyaB
MNTNLEIKVTVKNIKEIESKLENYSFEKLHQRDIYINHPNGRLKLREYKSGIQQLIFYKRNDDININKSLFKIHTYKTHDRFIEAYKNFRKYRGIIGEVEKERKYYRIGTCRIHLDRVKDLGDFVEIESVVKDEKKIKEKIKEINDIIVNFLEVKQDDKISHSYIDLIKSKKLNVSPSK